jgi:hypothetical protein
MLKVKARIFPYRIVYGVFTVLNCYRARATSLPLNFTEKRI